MNCQTTVASQSFALNTSGNTPPVYVADATKASIFIQGSGTVAHGTFTVQASNDSPYISNTPQNWANLNVTMTITTPGNYIIPSFVCCYDWIRLSYTDLSSGTSDETTTVTFRLTGNESK